MSEANPRTSPCEPETSSVNMAATDSRGRRRWVAIGALIVGCAMISGVASFLILTGLTPIAPTHNVVVTALGFNAALVTLLLVLIGAEVSRLLAARRRGIAGARLHIRVVGLFALLATVPAVLVAIVASVTLDRGLDRWFSGRNQQMLANAINIANSYLNEHASMLANDAQLAANDLSRVSGAIAKDKTRFDDFVRTQALLRRLDGLYVIYRDYSIVTRFVREDGRKYPVPEQQELSRAQTGKNVIILPNEDSPQARALIRLTRPNTDENAPDLFVYAVRDIDPTVLTHLRSTEILALEYANLEARRFGVQLAFALLYAGLALILLLSAIWFGLWFVSRMVTPIRRLIDAAQRVSEGDLAVRVMVKPSEGELSQLGATFNDMTAELEDQRSTLLGVNAKLDRRRRFTEAVLAGVTAGVVGLDDRGRVTLANRSAEAILGHRLDALTGRILAEVVPETAPLLARTPRSSRRVIQDQLVLHQGTETRTVNVRVTSESSGSSTLRGFVVTLDDISELVSAQRSAAWADVARRIAHEIKNPLTPIQLSAERLKRKYGRIIDKDVDIFNQCTDTIIRQVGDIGRMVDEFSAFARMPEAVIERHDLRDVVHQVIFLMRPGYADIDIAASHVEHAVWAQCDRRLITQVLTNLIKNAAEAIVALGATPHPPGRIRVQLDRIGDTASIKVIDNGCGLPQEQRQRLLEPYVTTRDKGTGLGLAIVDRVVKDHGGSIELTDAPEVANGGRGAMAVILLPIDGPTQPA